MTDKDSSQDETNSRRKLLKSVALGGAATAVPATWKTPIVHGVMVPAHAATTCGLAGSSISDISGLEANVTAALLEDNNDIFMASDVSVPQNSPCRALPLSYTSALIANGSVIFSTFCTTYTDEGDAACASPVGPCIMSLSIEVDAESHSLVAGDCVTARYTINNNCVVSAIAVLS